ncbi:MAG: darcynin [Proteobacteria bacterium]|nr:darcynin [Pseudomonadota bacterium]
MPFRSLAALGAALCALAPPGIAGADEPKPLRSEDANFSIFLLVRATSHWLALAPEERFAFLDAEIQPRLAAHPQVRMRFWDTEHLNARISDVILFETQRLDQYRSLIEGLRESRFWGHYFEVLEILPGIENAYAEHYDVEPYGPEARQP